MTFDDALKLIQNGKCLLLTGAGFSLGATNYKTSNFEFRTADKIAKELYQLCDVPDEDQDNDLSRASQNFKELNGSDKIIEFLRREFEVKEISPTQREYGRYNWRRCYTLNYDEILEKTYRENGKTLASVTPSQNSQDYNTNSVCVHLNGTIGGLNRDTINSEFKLTSSSYAQDYIKQTGWWDIFSDDLTVSDAIFFVGCSLKSDLDLIRLLRKTKDIIARTFFIVSPTESEIDVRRLGEYGTVLKIGAENFANQLKLTPAPSSLPIKKTLYHFLSPKIFSSKPLYRRKDFIDLLVQGRVDEQLLAYALKESEYYPYFIYRDKIEFISKKIESGLSHFVVHSDLGNGKTLFLKGLSYILANKGYNVYYIDHDYPSASDELAYICEEINGTTVIIAENYVDNIALLQKIKRYKHDHIVLLLSERTSSYETNFILQQKITATQPVDVDLNELSDHEIENLINLVEKNGLWQKQSGLTALEKFDFIVRKCKRHLSQFIIQLVEADDLEKRYNGVVEIIKNKNDYFEALSYILICAVLKLNVRLQNVIDDLNYDTLNNAFKKNKYVGEFIDFDNDVIVFKSSILAQYVLHHSLSYSDIDDSIIRIYHKLHEKRSSERIKKSLKEICLYENLNKLFISGNRKGLNQSIFKIYENISYLDYNKENPLFWLQFAIARLADEDYVDAKRCFDNAYSYAVKTGFDTFQIDNHFARYLLENASENKDEIDDPMEVFRQAHRNLMVKRRGQELKYHNYRIAGHYLNFYNTYSILLTHNEKNEFFNACNDMVDAMNYYLTLEKASKKDVVKHAKKKLESALTKQYE